DPLMAAIIAGVLSGTGVGLYLRYGGSAGGMDIVAAVLRRKVGIPMGTTFISVNFLNVVAGGLISRSLDIAFYTFIAMFVHSRMVERMQAGFSARKACFIVTSQADAIAEQIIRTLNRGVTFLHGSGGMSQQPTRVVYTVINMIELARLKEIIFNLDPAAFISINNASEVIGNRFVSWADEGFAHRVTSTRRVLPVLATCTDEEDASLSPPETAGDTPSTGPLPPPGG
ncbi:MAG TPA: YitT family protein, partial [Myxococcota bacterium]|nr:YitT family protein [Myxococcota bacterium]